MPETSSPPLTPLSFAQERMWVLAKLAPDSPAYNVPVAIRVHGALDVAALERALAQIVRRHEVLRTTFAETADGLAQIVGAEWRLPVTFVDLASEEPSVQERALEETLRADARILFDLQRGPLLRGLVVRLSEVHYVIQLTVHHIASDAWSIWVLMREVSEAYEAESTGRSAALPDLPVQYADFAVWQRRWASGSSADRQMTYWRRQLADAPVLELPIDRPRPVAGATFESGHVRLAFRPELTARLERLARDRDATLFMTLLAAVYALLFRITGQTDVTVGTPIFNRPRAELEPLIGLFLNSLALRVRLHGRLSFAQLVDRVRSVVLDGFAHQDVPFEHVVEEVSPQRDPSRSPLFDVLFTLKNTPVAPRRLGGLDCAQVPTATGTAKLDWTLLLAETGDGVSGTLEYRSELFDEATMRRFAGYVTRIVDEATRRPDAPIAELQILDDDEYDFLVYRFNRTAHAVGSTQTIHGIFEAAAVSHPTATAVVDEQGRLSYAELNARADRLAARLRAAGVDVDTPVGVLVPRTSSMAVAVLGVLKAGGAYVPFDPAQPPGRIRQVVEECRLRVLVADESLASSIQRMDLTIVDPNDTTGDVLPFEPIAVPPSALGYIIYTSGSTGRPKGVCLQHSALVNLIEWYRSTLGAGGSVLEFASLAFDASFRECFGAWSTGSAACIASQRTRIDPERLAEFIHDQGIVHVQLPVSMLQRVAEAAAGRESLFASVREITTTGEQMRLSEAIAALFRKLPECRLHNFYGPSETHGVSDLVLPANPDEWPSHPSVGYPIWNTQLHVLDESLRPVPMGVVGELYLGGACVGRGYWGRPDLTAERFIPDPFAPGERLYKTGDSARRLTDGTVEFLGRRDTQIKIRGARVEPAEVELALLDDPQVVEAVVCPRLGADHEWRLESYVVLRDADALTNVRRRLRDKLPDYMVPAVWTTLGKLPLNQSGKIDRSALVPATASPERVTAVASTALERAVAAIWSELLQIPSERIDVEASFFDIGGHSLMMARVLSRIARDFRIDLPIAEVLLHPTVRAIGEQIVAIYGDADLANEVAESVFEPPVPVDSSVRP